MFKVHSQRSQLTKDSDGRCDLLFDWLAVAALAALAKSKGWTVNLDQAASRLQDGAVVSLARSLLRRRFNR